MTPKLTLSKWDKRYKKFAILGFIGAMSLGMFTIWMGSIMLSLAIIVGGLSIYVGFGIYYLNKYSENKKDYFALIISIIALSLYVLSLYFGINLFVSSIMN